MLGPLAPLQGQEPRLVIISDPAAGFDYTLDDRTRTATRHRNTTQIKGRVVTKAGEAFEFSLGKAGQASITAGLSAKMDGAVRPGSAIAESRVTSEPLGTRHIEGLPAEGTRTMMTIPAGAVGNVNPIDIVTERWFSKDLQMEVLISRRDPRAGDTVYRLTNIVRAEPPPDLFVVPPDFTIREMDLSPLKGVEQAIKALEKSGKLTK
jgi:hypothetical protein